MSFLARPALAQQSEQVLTVPFGTGFEETDTVEVLFHPDSYGSELPSIETTEHATEGTRALSLRPGTSVSIPGISVEKGASYRFTFSWYGYQDFGMESAPTGGFSIALGDEDYALVEGSKEKSGTRSQTLVAEADGPVSLNISSSTNFADYDQYYIDDIRFEKLGTDMPGAVEEVVIVPDAGGALQASLQWKNPSLDFGGEPLKSLSGVIIERSMDAAFKTGVFADTVHTSEPGALQNKEVGFSEGGEWHFRFTCYNEQVSPLSVEESAWIGFDPIPAAPGNLRITAEAGGLSGFSWDKVEAGSHGGILGGEITEYVAVRSPLNGGKNDTVRTAGLSCTFKKASLGFYTFTVHAVKDGSVDGLSASVNSIAGNMPAQVIGINVADQPYGNPMPLCIDDRSQILGGCNNLASVCQVVVGSSSFSGPGLIDSLIFFVESTEAASVTQEYAIYLGYTDKDYFTTEEDFVPLGKLTKVFEGTVTVNGNEKTKTIPHLPFFYDRSANLLVSVVRGKQAIPGNSNVMLYSNFVMEEDARLSALLTSSEDFPVSDEPLKGDFLYHLTQYQPLMMLGLMEHANTVKGTVTDYQGAGLDSVSVSFKSRGKTPEFSYTVFTGKNGEYSFAYLPDGDYSISFQYEGMRDTTGEFSVSNQSELTIDATLRSAHQTLAKGVVADYGGNRIAGAEIRFTGIVDYQATSNDTGAFFLPGIYGSTAYRMSLSHPDFEPLVSEVEIGEDTMDLGLIELDYVAHPASRIRVEMEDGGAPEIRWEAPKVIHNEVIGALNTQSTHGCIGYRGQEIMAAATFESSDIAALGVDRLVKVKLYAGDTTAVYTLKIFKGKNLDEEVYSQEIGKLRIGWFETFLHTPVEIAENEGVRIAFHVESGYHHTPFGYDFGPATPKGSSLWVEGQWYDMNYLGYYDGNWNIVAVFGDTETRPSANGYRLYRGTKGTQEMDPDSWELVAVNLKDTVYKDEAWNGLSSNQYFYAVRADYYHENLSEPLCSGLMEKGMYHKVSFKFDGEGLEKDGPLKAYLDSRTHSYKQEEEAGSQLVLENVYHGVYSMKAGKDGFSACKGTVAILNDTTITVRVEENLFEPLWDTISTAENTVDLRWKMDDFVPFYDDMESYEDWSISGYGDYELGRVQEKAGLFINGESITWPNQDAEQSFIVFNPKTTTPALTQENWQPHSGTRMLTAMRAMLASNYDVLVKRIAKGGGTLSFWAYGVSYDGKPETFRVLYSTENDFTETSFKPLHEERQLESYPEWTCWKFFLPEDAVWFGIQCTSSGIFAFHLDDIAYEQDFVEAVPTGYEVYLDGSLAATLEGDVFSHTLNSVANGEHTVGIKAIYASGVSGLNEAKIKVGPASLEESAEEGITVYYSAGMLHVEGEWSSAVLYDLTGRRVAEVNRSSDRIDVSYLPDGVYVIAFKSAGNAVTVKKVVIK